MNKAQGKRERALTQKEKKEAAAQADAKAARTKELAASRSKDWYGKQLPEACTFPGCDRGPENPLKTLGTLKNHVNSKHKGWYVSDERNAAGNFVLEKHPLVEDYAPMVYDLVTMCFPALNMPGQGVWTGIDSSSEEYFQRYSTQMLEEDSEEGIWTVDNLKTKFASLDLNMGKETMFFVTFPEYHLPIVLDLLKSWELEYFGIEKFISADVGLEHPHYYNKWITVKARSLKSLQLEGQPLHGKNAEERKRFSYLAGQETYEHDTAFLKMQAKEGEKREDYNCPYYFGGASGWREHFEWILRGGTSMYMEKLKEKKEGNLEVLTIFWYEFRQPRDLEVQKGVNFTHLFHSQHRMRRVQNDPWQDVVSKEGVDADSEEACLEAVQPRKEKNYTLPLSDQPVSAIALQLSKQDSEEAQLERLEAQHALKQMGTPQGGDAWQSLVQNTSSSTPPLRINLSTPTFPTPQSLVHTTRPE